MKYIVYCRKSTDEKDKQVLSIDQQLAELKEFSQREHLEIIDFITEAKTAKIPGRELFAFLLKRIEKGEAQGIISWHPDRLARNSIDGGKIIYLLDTGKLLDLKFPSFWFDNTPQGKFMLNIAFGQSKYYVDNLSENVKRGMRHKLRLGIWPLKAPLGYTNNRANKTIEVNPETSKIVKKVFQLFAQGGKSFTEIAVLMAKFGIKKLNGNPIKVDQIKKMLKDKFYIGILKYDGEYYQATHKTFIPKQLFNEVQIRVEKIERPRQNGHNFAFRGLARCGECNAAITAEQHIKQYKNGNSQTFIHYRCTKKLKPCTQKYVPEIDLSEQISNLIKSCGMHSSWEPIFEKWTKETMAKDKTTIEVAINKLTNHVQETDQKLNRLLDAYLDQVIEPEMYKRKKNELFEEKLALEEKISKIKATGSSWLEPTREVIDNSLQCAKIACAKNNCHDLSIMAKKVGSNYSLLNRRLSQTLDYPYLTIQSVNDVTGLPPTVVSKSRLVTRQGLEP